MVIGNYTLHPIETGRFALDGGAMFGIVPKPLWVKTNPTDERNRIELAARALLIIGNGRNILVDNGNGSKFNEKQRDIYRLEMDRYELHKSLQTCGLTTDDITDVILTHLHFDHAGGSTYRDDGDLKPVFRNAKYYVQEAHWKQAMNSTEKDRGSFMPDDFMPLKEHGVLEFVEGEFEMFPNISMVVVNGHTAAQQLPKISDGKTTLLYCCDLFPTTSHIPLPYIMAYDLRPLTTLEEKKRILGSAVEEEWILFFEHDPGTAAGRVRRTEKGYAFDAAVLMD
ncbi:MAG TPA: MBL fold metallo-hydrolase [Bacteroidota bacterium]|jgi:glyoxylase-like metal-dependent hydrolase (beta-lactamase superfamily II)|nr:MBL fold metallo-hydrolase [Bacteroidota bacterium]